MPVSTQFVYLRPIHVATVRAKGPYETSAKAAWEEMFGWLNQAGLGGEKIARYGLLLDDPRVVAPEKRRYEACVELVDEARTLVPLSFSIRRLPSGAFARVRHVGGAEGLSKVISGIRDTWEQGEGLIIDTRRPVIEIYLDNPEHVPVEKQRIDLCFPVSVVENMGQSAA
jgi:AraC family transcriptional regulator